MVKKVLSEFAAKYRYCFRINLLTSDSYRNGDYIQKSTPLLCEGVLLKCLIAHSIECLNVLLTTYLMAATLSFASRILSFNSGIKSVVLYGTLIDSSSFMCVSAATGF